MSDICDEFDTYMHSVTSKYKQLEELNPQHELLKLIEDVKVGWMIICGGVEAGGSFVGTEEFAKEYPCNMNDTYSLVDTLSKFDSDLEKAIEREEKIKKLDDK